MEIPKDPNALIGAMIGAIVRSNLIMLSEDAFDALSVRPEMLEAPGLNKQVRKPLKIRKKIKVEKEFKGFRPRKKDAE